MLLIEGNGKYSKFIGCELKYVFELIFLSSRYPANDRETPGCSDSQAEMSVRVKKGGFMVEAF